MVTWITTDEAAYFDAILAGRADARPAKALDVTLSTGDRPARNGCHGSVACWTAQHPDWRSVQGWLVEVDWGDSVLLAAHSLVQAPDGELREITPMDRPLVFVPHPADPESFWALLPRHNSRLWPPASSGDAGVTL